jgi:hypothetical protein
VASGTAVGATLLAVALAPRESMAFWTDAMWHTERLGSVAYISNQSMLGMVARLGSADLAGGAGAAGPDPNMAVWAVVVVPVAAVWVHRARRAALVGDHRAGFALTGVAACLISPVTWVHHLIWLLPALIAIIADGRRRYVVMGIVAYAVLTSSVVWLWRFDWSGVDGLVGGSAYTWVCLALLALCPAASAARVVPIRGEVGVDLVKGAPVAGSRWLASGRADSGNSAADQVLARTLRGRAGGQRRDRIPAGDGERVGARHRAQSGAGRPSAPAGRVAGPGA